jgi:hypothetical protein
MSGVGQFRRANSAHLSDYHRCCGFLIKGYFTSIPSKPETPVFPKYQSRLTTKSREILTEAFASVRGLLPVGSTPEARTG